MIVNAYELDTSGLKLLRFTRNEKWLAYIMRNRGGYADLYPEAYQAEIAKLMGED